MYTTFLLPSLIAIFCYSPFVLSLPHDHSVRGQLFSSSSETWYHDAGHPIHNLFRRQADSSAFAAVGSPSWAAKYPTSTPDASKNPQEWTDALNAAVSAGKVPNIPTSTSTGTTPVYPPGTNPADPSVCAFPCRGKSDVFESPNGTIGIGFDDGPVHGPSGKLNAFLKSSNQKATHFMIGVAILAAPADFTESFDNGDDIAVHTYTHPYMTTLKNEDVLAQLGWTMQMIYDSTGGRVPRFWRPPYGDKDNRVDAIAREVFGLTAIVWNQDTADWSITSGGTTVAQVESNLAKWISGPKAPGLIILEHELSEQSVQAFVDSYPKMQASGWKTVSVAQLVPSRVDNSTGQAYWNAPEGSGSTGGVVQSADIIFKGGAPTGSNNPALAASLVSPSPSATSAASSSASAPTSSAGSSASTTPGVLPASSSGRSRTAVFSRHPITVLSFLGFSLTLTSVFYISI